MARPIERHPDPIVRDLQAIRRLSWAEPEGFVALEALLKHPLVHRRAGTSTETPQRVAALKSVLTETAARIEQFEDKNPPPFRRSVADASRALLRLEREFETMPVEGIRDEITKKWEGKGGGNVSVSGFRQHIEIPEVYEPFAREFRLFADEQKRREQHESRSGSDSPKDADPQSSIADRLRAEETDLHEKRLAHIDNDGVLRIRNEEEMLRILVMLSESARHEFKAVDHVPVEEWFSSLHFHEYLRLQLKRVREGEVTLERIRIVTDDELEDDGRRREQLDNLVRLHDEASAKLLLCRAEAIKKLELSFKPHIGLLVVDACAETAAITGKLGGGSIGRALVYVRETDEVSLFLEEYERLRMTAVVHDRELREILARTG